MISVSVFYATGPSPAVRSKSLAMRRASVLCTVQQRVALPCPATGFITARSIRAIEPSPLGLTKSASFGNNRRAAGSKKRPTARLRFRDVRENRGKNGHKESKQDQQANGNRAQQRRSALCPPEQKGRIQETGDGGKIARRRQKKNRESESQKRPGRSR